MIAADSCSVIAFIAGDESADTEAIEKALASSTLWLPPVAVPEILSDPVITEKVEAFVLELPVLDIEEGFWERAAKTRAKILRHGLRAKLGDALIAQSCIDHHTPLITRDKDFKHYAKHCGLKLHA